MVCGSERIQWSVYSWRILEVVDASIRFAVFFFIKHHKRSGHSSGYKHVVRSVRCVESSWNVMAHGDAREEKWRGNFRMEWVASTLHTTSEHGVSSTTAVYAQTSAASSRLNWRPPADLNGLANAVGSQYPSHYLGTWCIQHYYRWFRTPLLPAVHWTDAQRPI